MVDAVKTFCPPMRISLKLYPPPVILNAASSLPSSSFSANVFSVPLSSHPANILNVILNLSLSVSMSEVSSLDTAVAFTGAKTLPKRPSPELKTTFPPSATAPLFALNILLSPSKLSVNSVISLTTGAFSGTSSDSLPSIKNSAILVILVLFVYLKYRYAFWSASCAAFISVYLPDGIAEVILYKSVHVIPSLDPCTVPPTVLSDIPLPLLAASLTLLILNGVP